MENLMVNISVNSFWLRWEQTLNQTVNNVINLLPRMILAAILVMLGVLIGKIIARLVSKFFDKIGVDHFLGRLGNIEVLNKTPLRFRSGKIIAKLIYYFFFFLFALIAVDILEIQALSEIITLVFTYLPRLISAIFVFLLGIFLADLLRGFVRTACYSMDIPAASLISNLVFYFIFVNIALIALEQSGIETGFIQINLSIILAGIMLAFALGYGAASKPILSNILSGYYNRNKIQIGDTIKIEEVEGIIVAIDSGSFTIKTDEKTWVTLPLHKLTTEKYALIKTDELNELDS
jgi:small-conductance mechanosensitive channel